jgi:hypothetical protein
MKHLIASALALTAVTVFVFTCASESVQTQVQTQLRPSVRSDPDQRVIRPLNVITAPRTVPGINKPVRILRGRFTESVTLTNDTFWVLRGAVFFADGTRLTIQPGTQVIGETATRGTLVIERGAQIIADGTAAQPIVFTSDQPPGQRFRGDWGGLVINGRAPINIPGGTAIGEGSTGVYGGNNPNDNSGILRFVRVEFAGIEFSPDNELNGIAFQAVGRGTIVENIQVHFNKDDGVEMFGGTVDLKRVVLTAIGDDSIDWTHGWTGRMQFVVVLQRGDDTDNGIEADNLAGNNSLLPRSAPTIYNVTLVGDPGTTFGPESTDGARLREGTAGIIRNFIILGFKDDGLDVRDSETFAQIPSGALATTHGIIFGNRRPFSPASAPIVTASGGSLFQVDPLLVNPFNHAAPDWRPQPGSPALTLIPAVPPNDGFFEHALFMGALGPDPDTDWTRGWTFYGR